MTPNEKSIIKDNLAAFINNFGGVRIEKVPGYGFYVYMNGATEGNYIQFCYNIDYLNGWLYGVVQGAVRGEFKGKRKEADE